MAIIVHKYGGSSVASIDRLQYVARKVVAAKEAGKQVVVVVSAMGNSTNELIALAREITEQPNRRELDMLVSVGERVSMALLSMAIHALGHEAISFTGSQCGIVTNDAHSNARIIEVRPYRVQDELARNRIVIVAGFQGTSYRREVTTLGRGGSDMTAVALAAALGAEGCEIYSDVDGVYDADPRIVVDAQRLLSIGADEMLELARQGAKVLYDEAVAYAKRKGIALYAKATMDESNQGTIIRPDGWPSEALRESEIAPRAVASLPRILWCQGQAPDPLDALAEHEPSVPLLHFSSASDDGFEMAIDVTHCAEAEAVRRSLAQRLGSKVQLHLDWCNVALVGQDIGRSSHWPRAFLTELRAASIEVHKLIVRAHVLVALLPRASRELAMQRAHRLVRALGSPAQPQEL
ncbi:MAG: aspartate kinase [Myxococcota bacterium]|jgi:aspartate kinase|nr:aspartate kinase [Myxococcota bacterium]